MTPRMRRARTITAWILLTGSTIGWPISMLTWARAEPPFVLSLSWLAIIIGAAELLTSSQVHEDQHGDGDRS
jgi:ribose/xylose/arabinose/galactoside ABC-type transport system permease subunit